MNMNQIVNMITRLFMRKAINTGINKGIDLASRGRGGAKPAGTVKGGNPDATPAERAQAARGREIAKNARKAARLTRRLGR